MRIILSKFGTTLVSRPNGKEELTVFQPTLKLLPETEQLEVDFEGVFTFSPSWGDEFLTPLQNQLKDRLVMLNYSNLSVKETLRTLEEIHSFKFNLR